MKGMKKHLLLAALVMISRSALADDDEAKTIDLTCIASGSSAYFSRHFTFSPSNEIKLKWEEYSEPEHVGDDAVVDEHIQSCIKESSRVTCININRITGDFYYNSGRPEYTHANFPKIWAYYPGDNSAKGHCEVGKKRAF